AAAAGRDAIIACRFRCGATAHRPDPVPVVRDDDHGDPRTDLRLLLVRAPDPRRDDEGRWGRWRPRVSRYQRHERGPSDGADERPALPPGPAVRPPGTVGDRSREPEGLAGAVHDPPRRGGARRA